MPVRLKLLWTLLGTLASTVGELATYALVACGVWLFFFVLFRARLRARRISRREPAPGQIAREMARSVRSIAVFGLVTAAVIYAGWSGWTRIYLRVSDYGWGWFFLSIVLMIILHDAYFYWTHRLMHHPRLYRAFHLTHHLSTSPTPWAAYSFSPVEALVQAGIGPLAVVAMPVHPAAFSLFMLWQISFNVFGHCGYEIFPRGFLKCRAGLVLNSITHHALHHEKYRSNFGLYFNVWDRLMGTNHPNYEERFEAAAGAVHEGSAALPTS